MKKNNIVVLLAVVFLLLSGCTTTYRLTEPIPIATQSSSPVPIHIGVLLADGEDKFSLNKRDFEFLVGDAVSRNIGNSLQPHFKKVTVSTTADALPSGVNNIAYVRFTPGTKLILPLSRFEDIKMTIVISFEVYDKTGKKRVWKTTASGEKTGRQPPVFGLINIGQLDSFYKELLRDSVQTLLGELNKQISASGKKALQR